MSVRTQCTLVAPSIFAIGTIHGKYWIVYDCCDYNDLY